MQRDPRRAGEAGLAEQEPGDRELHHPEHPRQRVRVGMPPSAAPTMVPNQGNQVVEWAEQSGRKRAHFINVVSEDAKIIGDFGTVAHSLGFRKNMFNTADSRLSAFHGEVMRRVGPR